KDSELVKLEVHKQSKIWHFHIRLSQVLPTEIYALLSVRLQETFQQFAQIDMTLYTDNKDCASETVHAYWQHFLQTVSNLTPAYKDLVLDQTPEVNNNKIMLTARNEAEGNALKKRLEQPFQAFCRKIGAPSFSLEIDVKSDAVDLKKFREQKALEDQELVLKTIKQKEARDQKNQKNEQHKPFMIGYKIQDEPIQMEEIQEEERRVTIQCYVFSTEIRQLRSGRSLLIVKATDYTDSLQIKMFSKGDDDVTAFEQLKEGMWIKARGSIQTDMYTSELAMMANA